MLRSGLIELVEPCFRPRPPEALWVQYDIGLTRPDPAGCARDLFGRLVPLLDAALIEGGLGGWFCMRKPPDLRLRLDLRPAGEGLAGSVADLLAGMREGRLLRSVARGDYAPELDRFGGARAMDRVHAWFSLDSRLWVELDRAGMQRSAHDALLILVLDHLFETMLDERPPVSAWRRLAGLIGTPAWDAAAQPYHPPPLGADAVELFTIYRAGNQRLAEALVDSVDPASARLVDIVATAALFAFNRHGYAGDRSGPLVAARLAGLRASVS